MINCTKKEISNLEFLSAGRFGLVYKKDDETAYKIYRHSFYDDWGNVVNNPSLKLPKKHFEELIKRSTKLKYSTPINDVIYIDGIFGGISIPYYDGKTLFKYINQSLKLKLKFAKKIVLSSKELTSHFIYPTDYKLNNIMCNGKDAFLVDLDDHKTHISNISSPILRSISINSLCYTVHDLFSFGRHFQVNKQVRKELDRTSYFGAFHYKKIDDYIKEKEKERDFTFIDSTSNLQKIKDNPKLSSSRLVYIVDKKETDDYELLRIINYLKENNLSLYDFVLRENIGSYDYMENIGNAYLSNNDDIKTLKKSR